MDSAANHMKHGQGRDSTGRRRVTGSVVAFVFLVLTVFLAWFWLRLNDPPEYEPGSVPFQGYDMAAMQAAVQPEHVARKQQEILAFGSRFMGQPGFYQCEAYLRQSLTDAGLKVYEQENYSPAPVTVRREIRDEQGSTLPGVELYPFLPNLSQPMTTPPEGLVGELTLLTSDTLVSRRDFSNCIGVLHGDPKNVSNDLKYTWSRYAALGVKALIVAHPDGLEHVQWKSVATAKADEPDAMIGVIPVNYVRLAASAGIFDHLGETVRLHVRTEIRPVRHVSLIGVLHGKRSSNDALLISAPYDATSPLPDLAPGVAQAISPATALALLDGLRPYKDSLKRDVIFAFFGAQFMNCAGESYLLSTIEENLSQSPENPLLKALGLASDAVEENDEDNQSPARIKNVTGPIQAKIASNEALLGRVQKILKAFEHPQFLVSGDQTRRALNSLDKSSSSFLDEQHTYVLNTEVLERSEDVLTAKIAFLARGDEDLRSAEFARFREQIERSEEALSAAGFSLGNFLETPKKREYAQLINYRKKMHDWLREIEQDSLTKRSQLNQSLEIARWFAQYNSTVVLEPRLAPAFSPKSNETVSFMVGAVTDQGQGEGADLQSIMSAAWLRLPNREAVSLAPLAARQDAKVEPHLGERGIPLQSTKIWSKMRYPARMLVNLDRAESYSRSFFPVNLPFMTNVESIRHSLRLLGETTLSVAHGNGKFVVMNFGQPLNFGGKVLVSNIGKTAVPNYPLKNALVYNRDRDGGTNYRSPGYYNQPLIHADIFGKYDLRKQASDFMGQSYVLATKAYSPVAVGYGHDGQIQFMKDEGEEGQRLFKSVGLNYRDRKSLEKVNIVTFRAAPVAIFDLINPQSLKNYTNVEFIDQAGLQPFPKGCVFGSASGLLTFIKPDERFFVKLMAGAPDNEHVQETRAFLLGTDPKYQVDPEKEIDGPGYLAGITPILLNVPSEIAASMAWLNGKRLALQNAYGMADERTNEFQEKSVSRLEASQTENISSQESTLLAREAVTYSTLNHPVLRKSIAEAVFGILWYLGLLTPFAFFFEKMAFGFTDIRKQLIANLVIFLIVFILLRLLHPAFQMIRSSMMILLGFLIVLIGSSVLMLFVGKFKDNLESLRQHRGIVAAAEVNMLGVIGVALMLGLNNMNRRWVRTWLTCLTLVLLTFVMICFTSVDSDLVDSETVIGKAPYQGILYKELDFHPITSEAAFQTKYAGQFQVTPRKISVPRQRSGTIKNSELEIVATDATGVSRKAVVNGLIQLSSREPLANQIKLLTQRGWFVESDDQPSEEPMPVMIPLPVAEALRISAEDVDKNPVPVRINGANVLVRGIFDAESLKTARDMDGHDFLPFDANALTTVQQSERGVRQQESKTIADDNSQRLPAERVIIGPIRESTISAEDTEFGRTISLVISMADLAYSEAREEVREYLEQSGHRTFYGIDGIAYMGQRTRQRTFQGVIELIIPLVLAALTVLNTMRGSVYERTYEIRVYNAVGIAPRIVFFIFFAEAFVYAVVGAELGYLLSQGVGRILTELNMTGGLNMTFTSFTSIYASLAIAASVFLSTWFPARSAMQIAAPAEEAGWKLPEPELDDLAFDLPFTFNHRDRIAILSFFDRYLRDHGEGSAASFFAGEPRTEVIEVDGKHIPSIRVPIWLKPFDLGVSQEMTILLPEDPETGEYKASIALRRKSGKRESWMRLNKEFIRQIRRHFLHWRAVGLEMRAEMFDDAKSMIESQVQTAPQANLRTANPEPTV